MLLANLVTVNYADENKLKAMTHVPDHNLIVYGGMRNDPEIKLFDLNSLETSETIDIKKMITGLLYIRDRNCLLVGGEDGGLSKVSLPDLTVKTLYQDESWLLDKIVEVSPDEIVFCDKNNCIVIFNIQTKVAVEKVHINEEVKSIICAKDRNLVIMGTSKGHIIIYDLIKKEIITNKKAHFENFSISCLYYDLKNTCLISGGYDGWIRKWKLNGEGSLHLIYSVELEGKKPFISGLLVYPSEELIITSCMDKYIRKLDYVTGELIGITQTNLNGITNLNKIEGSEFVIIADDNTPLLSFINYREI